MSNAEKIVMVPRELLERYVSSVEDHNYGFDGDVEIRALLDAPTEQHQGEPVVLPAERELVRAWGHDMGGNYEEGTAFGWNACLDEIAKLGPLYTHADPAEVERLRQLLGQARSMVNGATDEWHKSVTEVLKND